jgi:Calmodulin-binding
MEEDVGSLVIRRETTLRKFKGGKKLYGIIGKEVRTSVNPSNFLHSHGRTGPSGIEIMKATREYVTKNTLPGKRKPTLKDPIPKFLVDELPSIFKEERDFVIENMHAAHPRKKCSSASEHILNKNFGKVPSYLERIKQDIAKEEIVLSSVISDSLNDQQQLTEGEISDIKTSIDEKLIAVNQKYQTITHRYISSSCSTLGEIKLKEALEKRLDQLEALRAKFSNHREVLIT